jgi:molybdenum cofactor cytidylyltransferase
LKPLPAEPADHRGLAAPVPRVAGLVLAAGRSTRFGGRPKLLVQLEGRPILQHVLDAARIGGLDPVVVVLGDEAEAIEAAMVWAGERRVVNPDPAAGLAVSLRVGLDAVAALAPLVGAAVVLLGDQPRTAPSVVAALIAAAEGAPAEAAWFVVPDYAGGGGPNPVLIRREGFDAATSATGDRGIGPLISARPERVFRIPVPGTNPDIDTPADLERLRAAAPTL